MTTTTTTTLGAALSEQAIRNVNFFNGRLVTSRDMARTQAAQHEADARLGQGIGAGVVQGLEVATGDALLRQLTIRPGLAICRSGQTLCLGAAQVLALVPGADASVPASTGGFARCGVLSGGSYVAGNGLYLLTLAPITVNEGKAAVLALEPGNARCNTDAIVDAVQFRLLRIDQALLADRALDANPVGAAAISKWRSAVAYACFGFPGLANAHGLLGMPAAPDLLDAMRARGLSDCDVPLALVYLTASQGIVYVDRWSVRRRVASLPASPTWAAWLGAPLEALGEAQLAQFQEQLREIPTASLAGLHAADWFSWLPPGGFLDAAGARQLDWSAFLDNRQPARTVTIAAGDVRALLSQALRRDAVLLDPSTSTPRFRVYRIDGNGPWFFVREAPNAPHAEEVWLDGDRARLPGIHDVQSAIDALRGRLCGEVSVWPGIDVQQRIDELPPDSDLRLCFESGNYKLQRPLRLRGLRHVIVHGGGAASLLVCEAAETALMIDTCASVMVSDIAVRGGRIGAGKGELGSGLMGALTVLDVPQVRIERVTARCNAGAALGAGGIVVRQSKPQAEGKGSMPRHAEIVDCDVQVGEAQLGILCVDCELTDLRHNRLVALTPERPPERGIVVAGSAATEVTIAHNTVASFAQGISLGLSRSETTKGAPLQVKRAMLTHNTVQVALGVRDAKRNRFGLFVGNAESLLLEGNRVTVLESAASRTEMESIRLSGLYGMHLVVRANHMSGTRTGITYTPQAPLPQSVEVCLWLFDANLAEQAGEVIRCDDAVRKLLRAHDNVRI